MKVVSQISSWVFLPLLMPMYALLAAMYIPSDQDYIFNNDCMFLMYDQNKFVVLIYFALFGIVFPGISYLIMRASGMISTIEMDDKSERNLPILITLAYCTALYVILVMKFSGLHAPKYIFGLALSGIAVAMAQFFLNIWKKVSIHAAGAGIAFGFLFAYALGHAEYHLGIVIFPLLASGIVMSARLYLKKHDLIEVTVGWFLGAFLTFTITYLY
ncbi:MAG: membrane-associated phospholipid phosphatase [Crocinitomicaceae bacterium]|jgi:membrane-associated phospholipid phosphatase